MIVAPEEVELIALIAVFVQRLAQLVGVRG